MKYPISQLIRNPDVESQESAARELAPMVASSDRISTEVTKDGLLLYAVSELDLELAVNSLRAVSRQLIPGKPRINYVDGDAWEEPYVSLRVTIPSTCLAEVLTDLQARCAEIQKSESLSPGETSIRAAAPMAELFGYSTSLRSLTRGRGRHEQEYLEYRPFPGASGPHE